jgi:hypothetical protein
MTTQGEWHEWSYGKDYRGWTLECGKLVADIRQHGETSRYYMTINKHPYGPSDDLEAHKHLAETQIVSRIAAVLPAYRLIEARVRQRTVTCPPPSSQQRKIETQLIAPLSERGVINGEYRDSILLSTDRGGAAR